MTPTPTPHDPRLLAAIAAGGVVGALGRWVLGSWLPGAPAGFPWSTWAVNVSGAFAMGLLVAWLAVRPGAHPFVRPVIGTGLLGGWTTYSAFTLDLHTLAGRGAAVTALVYVLGTFVVGVLACAAGILLGDRWWPDTDEGS